MLATFFSISQISTARRPSGFEIRCKKNTHHSNILAARTLSKQLM